MAQSMQSGTPMGLLNNNSPQMQKVTDFIKACGGNAQQAFYMLAKQKDVDPEQFLNQVRQMMPR